MREVLQKMIMLFALLGRLPLCLSTGGDESGRRESESPWDYWDVGRRLGVSRTRYQLDSRPSEARAAIYKVHTKRDDVVPAIPTHEDAYTTRQEGGIQEEGIEHAVPRCLLYGERRRKQDTQTI